MTPVADAGEFTGIERDLLVEAAIDVIGLWWIAGAVRAELGEGPVPQSVQYTPELRAELVESVRQAARTPMEPQGPDGDQVIARSLDIIGRFLGLELVYPSGGALSAWYEPWTISTSDALAPHRPRVAGS